MRFLNQAVAVCLLSILTHCSTLALPTSSKVVKNDDWLKLSVIHTNDVHSRVDPANDFGVGCTAEDIATGHCYGGTARHKTVIERLREKSEHSLLLDGGDEFQGTLFYTYYKGNVTAQVMNELGYDLATIGNHEWDNGPETLRQYWPQLKFPVVCANIDFSKNPELGKLVKPYHIFEDIGVAVIGYITETTGDISNAGPSVSFTDPIPAVQKYVDELQGKGIKRILALSHNGYGPDMELAAKTHGVDLIVGGHSHSFLGDASNPLSEGPYPTVIKNLKGENTLIVQAFCWGRYIGHLDVVFNPEGKIVAWAGEPILVQNSIPPNTRLLKEIDAWRYEFEEWGHTVLGVAKGSFDQNSCKQRECTMGNLVADAMLEHARTPIFSKAITSWENRATNHDPSDASRPWTDFAFINSGGIRSGLPAGNITVEMILTTSPFGNGLVQTQMTGAEILEMLEAVSAGRYRKSQKQVTSNIQVSGLRYSFDSSQPLEANHLHTVEVQGYDQVWTEIVPKKKYWVVTLDFLLKGGDNIMRPLDGRREIKLEQLDNVLMEYIENSGVVSPYLDGRIKDVAPGKESLESPYIHDKRIKTTSVWPAGTPEHIKTRYPGGVEEMLGEYIRLREVGSSRTIENDSRLGSMVADMSGSQHVLG
ncbi:hypothetical protein EC968_008782 [Mortierella alpina]|nr:hypothetical protein EC968_008782 [Mortierella alpina]